MVTSILLSDLRGGGAERACFSLAEELQLQGHAVEFVLMRARGELLEEARASFPVAELGVERARHLPLALARYLRRRRPAALLAAMWPLTVLAPAARLLSRHRCRLVVSEHNTLSRQYESWGKGHRVALRASMALGYRLADARVGVSAGVAQDMARLAFMRTERFEAIHNPIAARPEPSAEALDRAEALWSAPPGVRILTVGSLKTQKNHPLLLRAFARLAGERDTRLLLLGSGQGEAALRALAAELGIAERVVFAGFHADPTPFYATADLFVLSSDHEGFGNVIVEALARGTPVVSTDCPSGPAEILENGKFGTLVPVGDEAALARAMAEALDRDHDREALRARARNFAPEVAAKRYLELLT